jgi:hypothetical protein
MTVISKSHTELDLRRVVMDLLKDRLTTVDAAVQPH